jgi:hypothetical protein
MLNLLDQVVQRVLDDGWTTTPPPAKPGFFFTVPDDDWLQKVKTGVGERLNIYLYEVRENRDFRRSEWDVVTLADGSAARSHPPVYLDCHYLISAWSASEDSEALTPILDEHRILGEALRVLMRNPEVIPAGLGFGGGPVFQQARVNLTVAPPETPRVLNDFWSTMKLPWRPAIQLIAMAPLDLLQDTALAPRVTTFVQRYQHINGSGSADERVTIGGWVLRDADGSPIVDAAVQRITTGGELIEEVRTDAEGRFVFVGLSPGIHRLRAAGDGLSAPPRDLDVPAGPAGDHIFRLT